MPAGTITTELYVPHFSQFDGLTVDSPYAFLYFSCTTHMQELTLHPPFALARLLHMNYSGFSVCKYTQYVGMRCENCGMAMANIKTRGKL